MINPFKIDENENVVISLSGGRTSGYLLYNVIKANNGIPDNCKVIFQNTGKEKEATYNFIKEIGINWDVKVIWLEYSGKKQYKEVNYDTAARNGEPFKKLIIDKKYYLPNMMQRICTIGLKSKTMSYYLSNVFGWESFKNWLGIRADEPKRFKIEGTAYQFDIDGNIKHYKRSGLPIPVNLILDEEKILPLKDAGVNKNEVLSFWRNNCFDLKLFPDDSNCDLCFLKGVDNILHNIRKDPRCADFWIEMEKICSTHHGKPVLFRSDRPRYRKLKKMALEQPDFFVNDSDIITCSCTD
jgi:3'-phosphoadenosine 5'-phosphosulfate sulfotransferase (PAPS reductase)/FAD synthetase